MTPSAPHTLMSLLALALLNVVNPAQGAAPFEEGVKCLFIGHSFFVPPSREFNVIASMGGDFPMHEWGAVFSGGQSGSPKALWEDPVDYEAIDEKLSEQDVDLLAMTAYSDADSAFEDYQNWIDLARSYNPEISFLIGVPWTKEGAETDTDDFDRNNRIAGANLFSIVQELREAYPDNSILFINYGLMVSEMKRLFEDGNLPDVDNLLGPGATSLFTDVSPGHGGQMVKEMVGLLWVEFLYGKDYLELTYQSPYNAANVAELMSAVLEANEDFNEPTGGGGGRPWWLVLISSIFFCL